MYKVLCKIISSGTCMPYIIHFIQKNEYLIKRNDGGFTTTNLHQEAIKSVLFDDFELAHKAAQNFSTYMVIDIDYKILSTPKDPYYVVEIIIPKEIAPTLKDIKKVIKNGKARIFLTNMTTEDDAMDDLIYYGVSTGVNTALYTITQYKTNEQAISKYLNERFGNHWEIKLLSITT